MQRLTEHSVTTSTIICSMEIISLLYKMIVSSPSTGLKPMSQMPKLATLAPLQLETDTSAVVTSNSYRLQRFAKNGTDFSRVRLAEQNL